MGGEGDLSDDELVTRWGLVVEGVGRTHERVLQMIEETGLPGTWFEALHQLLDAPAHRLPMNRLARDLSMTAGGLTKLADRLARAGYIDRRGSDDDRRIVYAALTDEGLAIAKQAADLYRRALRRHVLGPLDAERVQTLATIMGVLHAEYPIETPDEVVRTDHDPAVERRSRPRTDE